MERRGKFPPCEEGCHATHKWGVAHVTCYVLMVGRYNIIEAVAQLRGKADGRQIPHARRALV